MRCAPSELLGLVFTVALGSSVAAQNPPAAPPKSTPAPAPATAPTAGRARQATAPAANAKLALTIMVTALDGKTIPETTVKAAGPVDREAPTDPSGLVTFQNMAPGTYRLRFEHPQFVTFEKEITLGVGKPLRTSASLTAAPPPPPPVKADPPPAPTPAAPPPAGNFAPNVVSFESWIDSNFVGRAPSKRLAAGCTASATSTLVQTNESPGEQSRPDVDETIYVVAGEGSLKMAGRDHGLTASTLITIPRGTPYSISRRGSRPLMFVSTVSGRACDGR